MSCRLPRTECGSTPARYAEVILISPAAELVMARRRRHRCLGLCRELRMETYYTLLDIPTEAPTEEIVAAYQCQRERYRPERVATLGNEFERLAVTRLAELERAYAILADPARRRAYDRSIGVASPEDVEHVAKRTRLSRRERLLTIGGALAGLLLIALGWVLAGHSAQPGLPPIAEMRKPAPAFA